MTLMNIPEEYQNLIGRNFIDLGKNGMGRAFHVINIEYNKDHQHGPWLARCRPHSNNSGSRTCPRYRNADRFLRPNEYEEI